MTKSIEQPIRRPGLARRGRPPQVLGGEDRRRRLIEATMAVIARDGLAAASTRAVAAEAGMNQAMLHYSFAGKDALLAAALDEIQAGVARVLADSLAGVADLPAAVDRIARAYWAHVAATPAFQRVQYELTLYALTTPGQEDLARRQYQGYAEALVAALAHLPTAPGTPLPVLAGLSVAAMDGLILQYLATGDREAVEAQLEVLITALQSRCGAPA